MMNLDEESQTGKSESERVKKNEQRLKMVSASYYIPKDNKLGEDAHFICADEDTVGVADGVGGFAKQGIDAGEYARSLMINSADTVRKIKGLSPPSPSVIVDPKRVISEAFNGAKGLKGASTACIVALNGCVLDAANVGDSGFMVFRDKKLLYSSPLQQHWFNIPYQLGNQKGADRPGCASELKHRVAAGDILVLGTDGLLDNLFSEEIEMILEKKEEVKPEELAEEIATRAFSKSLKNDCETPFSREYKSFGGQMHLGGKNDDITVIVSHIVNVDN